MANKFKTKQRKRQRVGTADTFIGAIMKVGPAFTDLAFSFLIGHMDMFERGYQDGEVQDGEIFVKYKVGEGLLTIVCNAYKEIDLVDGKRMVTILLSIVRKHGKETMENTCKNGFVSLGRIPTKSPSEPPQILFGKELMTVAGLALGIEWPEVQISSLTVSQQVA